MITTLVFEQMSLRFEGVMGFHYGKERKSLRLANAVSGLLLNVLADGMSQTYSLSRRIFIISTADLATEVPGPKIAATPAL